VGNPSRGHRGSRDGIKRGQRRRYKEEEKTSSSNDGAFPVEVDVTPEKVREVGKFNVPTQALCFVFLHTANPHAQCHTHQHSRGPTPNCNAKTLPWGIFINVTALALQAWPQYL
jgi:hypothetical protein